MNYAGNKDTTPFSDVGPVKAFADVLQDQLDAGDFPTKGDRTRQRLKIAAASALEESGYPDLKVADVCKAADVAMGTFYVYFKDKTEISIEVVLGFMNHLYDEVRLASGKRGSYESIYRANLFFVHAYRSNPGLMRSHVQLQSQEAAFRALWEPRHVEWLNVLAASIAKRGNLPNLLPENAMKYALALEGMVFGYLYSTLVTGQTPIAASENEAEDTAELLSVIWYRSVYGTDPPALGNCKS